MPAKGDPPCFPTLLKQRFLIYGSVHFIRDRTQEFLKSVLEKVAYEKEIRLEMIISKNYEIISTLKSLKDQNSKKVSLPARFF